MKVSHEVPKILFEESREFNDFDYCLVHMCEKDPEYLQFYIDRARDNRMIVLDNSIFELGEAVTPDFLLGYAKKINPTHIVPPDVLHNGPATVEGVTNFISRMKEEGLNYKIVAVAQGKTEDEYVECFKFFLSYPDVDMIAVPYDLKFYDQYLDKTSQNRFVLSRQNIIERLLSEFGKDMFKKNIHLLGCSNPIEFKKYSSNDRYRFITSVDTSCPIITGVYGQRLSYEKGLSCEKIKDLLADNLDIKLNNVQLSLIRDNIKTFAQLVGKIK